MSFKKYLEETNNASGFSKEQKLVLLVGKELEESNYKLKETDNEKVFKNFKEKEGKFSFSFKKDDIELDLIVENKKDGNYEISLSNDKRATSEEIKIDNYLKGDNSLLVNYMKERINNIETNPFSYTETKRPFQSLQYENNNLRIKRSELNDDNFDNFNNNFVPNPHSEFGMNFGNVGYNDLHGDLPNFSSGFNDYFNRPRGNLMGPEAFRSGIGGMGGIRYDPITPFGSGFDFIPQYDAQMKKKLDPSANFDFGIKKDNRFHTFGGNNFGGGGYNPFI